jgi:rRNA maturation endonuclease Nob1
MAERVEHPDSEDIEEKQRRERAEFRTNLEKKLSDDAIERLEIMDELRETGKLGVMIDSGDFSDLPDELRPDDYEETSS